MKSPSQQPYRQQTYSLHSQYQQPIDGSQEQLATMAQNRVSANGVKQAISIAQLQNMNLIAANGSGSKARHLQRIATNTYDNTVPTTSIDSFRYDPGQNNTNASQQYSQRGRKQTSLMQNQLPPRDLQDRIPRQIQQANEVGEKIQYMDIGTKMPSQGNSFNNAPTSLQETRQNSGTLPHVPISNQADFMKHQQQYEQKNLRNRNSMYSPSVDKQNMAQQQPNNAGQRGMQRMASDATGTSDRINEQQRQRALRHDSVGFQGSGSSLNRGVGTIQFQRESRIGSQEHRGNYDKLHHNTALEQKNMAQAERFQLPNVAQTSTIAGNITGSGFSNQAAIGAGNLIIQSRPPPATLPSQMPASNRKFFALNGQQSQQPPQPLTFPRNGLSAQQPPASTQAFRTASLSLSISRDATQMQQPVASIQEEFQQMYTDKLYAKGLRNTSQATDMKGIAIGGGVTPISNNNNNNYAMRDQRNSTMNTKNERSALGLMENPNPISSSFSPSKRQVTNQSIAQRLAKLKIMNQGPPHESRSLMDQQQMSRPGAVSSATTTTSQVRQQRDQSRRRQRDSVDGEQQLEHDDSANNNNNQVMHSEADANPVNVLNAEEIMFGQKTAMINTAQTPYGRQVAAFQKGATSFVAGSPSKQREQNLPMTSVYQKFNGASALDQQQTQQQATATQQVQANEVHQRQAHPVQQQHGTGHFYTVNQHMAKNTSFAGPKHLRSANRSVPSNKANLLSKNVGGAASFNEAQQIQMDSESKLTLDHTDNKDVQMATTEGNNQHKTTRVLRTNALVEGASNGRMIPNLTNDAENNEQSANKGLPQEPTKRQRLSLSQSKESSVHNSAEEETKNEPGLITTGAQQQWSQQSNCTNQSNSLISDDDDAGSDQNMRRAVTDQYKNKRGGAATADEPHGPFLDRQLLDRFEWTLRRDGQLPEDLQERILQKVNRFIEKNPINPVFIKREKARLPYSVFKPHSQNIYFLKSIFANRPPTAFFPYPSYCHLERTADRVRKYNRDEIEYLFMAFKIADTTHIYNAVVNTCKNAGFNMVEGNNVYFNLQWTGYITSNDIRHLNKYQKTNHFPGSSQLGRKDLLWRNMNRLRIKHPQDFLIAPMSYLISEDYELFQAERERDPSALWILKPVASSCGRGIKVIQAHTKIGKREGILACKYIDNPHLINGLKYDLRVYVLVTSFNPLKVYIYTDGLVRFATEKYSNDPSQLSKKFIHLTNFSVNKKNTTKFVKNNDQKTRTNAAGDESEDDNGAASSKWDFAQLKRAFEKQGSNFTMAMAQTKDIIIKTLISVEPHIVGNLQRNPTNRVNCFEIYGFDVMIDDNMKPWVLEVNVLPSLSSSSPFDKRIKTMLVCDALTCVGLRGYDKSKFHAQTTDVLGLAPFTPSLAYSEVKERPFTGNEKLSKDELEMLMDLDEEFLRKGNFERIFPLPNNATFYEQFFENKRYQNAIVAAYLTSEQTVRDQLLLPKHKRQYFSEV